MSTSPSDSNVQLPGGTQTGPQVRTTQSIILDSGTATTVQTQVVQVADDTGTILGTTSDQSTLLALLIELRAIRRLLAQNLGVLDLPNDGPVMGVTTQ